MMNNVYGSGRETGFIAFVYRGSITLRETNVLRNSLVRKGGEGVKGRQGVKERRGEEGMGREES